MVDHDGNRAAANGARQQVGFVVLTFEFHKERSLWVGRCLELGTATDGRSLEKVEAELSELVTLHLDALDDVGERERFFREHDIILYTPDPPNVVERRVALTTEPTLIRFRSVPLSSSTERKEPVGV